MYTYYNITNLTNQGNATTILTFVGGVNDIMDRAPAILMLIAVYVILILVLMGKGFDPFKTFAASSFVAMILSIMLYGMNLINGFTLILFCTLCPISIFLLWVWGGQSFG